MNTKVCFKCKTEKSLDEFYLKKNGHYHSYCNECRSIVKKEWNIIHREENKEYKRRNVFKDKKYREENRELIKKRSHDSYHKNKEKRKLKRQEPKYKEGRKIYEKQWREENREHCNAYFKDYYERNPSAKLARTTRNRINKVLRGEIKYYHMDEMVGCSLDFFRQHLESQFTDGMTWANHGFGVDKWNVHHDPPLASYDFRIPKQQKEAFHWTHSSPKWTLDNISENSWMDGIRYTYKK
jgi:hypothetical protein